MFRKILILVLMGPLVAAAFATGASSPLLLLMVSLLLIALVAPSAREDVQEE